MSINRAFVYGDLLFETMRFSNGQLQLAPLHYNRLMRGAKMLHFDTALSFADFYALAEAAVKQEQLKDARVRFVLHRNGDGFYTPHHHHTQFYAEAFPYISTTGKSLHLGLYTALYKPCHELSNLKSGNALIYVMAGIWAVQNGFDEVVILNEHGCVAEATGSNIFVVKEEIVYTPALEEGCVDGVMRSHTIARLRQSEYTVKETVVPVTLLLEADAVFLTNAVRGIVAVTSFGDKAYRAENILI